MVWSTSTIAIRKKGHTGSEKTCGEGFLDDFTVFFRKFDLLGFSIPPGPVFSQPYNSAIALGCRFDGEAMRVSAETFYLVPGTYQVECDNKNSDI